MVNRPFTISCSGSLAGWLAGWLAGRSFPRWEWVALRVVSVLPPGLNGFWTTAGTSMGMDRPGGRLVDLVRGLRARQNRRYPHGGNGLLCGPLCGFSSLPRGLTGFGTAAGTLMGMDRPGGRLVDLVRGYMDWTDTAHRLFPPWEWDG
jgi:hypothetical protein